MHYICLFSGWGRVVLYRLYVVIVPFVLLCSHCVVLHMLLCCFVSALRSRVVFAAAVVCFCRAVCLVLSVVYVIKAALTKHRSVSVWVCVCVYVCIFVSVCLVCLCVCDVVSASLTRDESGHL